MPTTQRIEITEDETMQLKILAMKKKTTIAEILATLVRKFISQELRKEAR